MCEEPLPRYPRVMKTACDCLPHATPVLMGRVNPDTLQLSTYFLVAGFFADDFFADVFFADVFFADVFFIALFSS